MKFKVSLNMKFIIVFSSLLYLAESYRNLTFEKNNKCGCNLEYSCENCAPCEKLRPFCESNDKKFQDFHADHLQSCRKWFLEGYNVELINKVDGTVLVTFLMFEFKSDIQYEIELRILDDSPANPVDSILTPVNHSTKTLRVLRTSYPSCRQVIPFNFTFLYSGTYQLYVTKRANLREAPDSVSSACLSSPFNISSLYQKKFLNSLEPVFYSHYRPQSHSLLTTMSGDGLNLAKKVYIRFSLCGKTNVVMESHLKQGSDGLCCDSYGENELESCPCTFSNGFQELTCSLKNVTNGDYCIVVGFYDPRCKPGTIWTKGAFAYCMWSYNLTLSGNKTSTEFKLPIKNSGFSWPITVPIIFLGVLITVFIGVFLYKPKCIRKLRLHNYATNSLITHSSESSSISWYMKDGCEKAGFQEVLLLYPRDCHSFMNAMAEFRSFLKNNCCKVYDPWDDEIYNNVVESCETWSLPFIMKENLKIILVVSECSKRFEEAYLGNFPLSYKEPQTLDIIFPQSLASVHHYFCNRFDSYQRVYVIQLEGSPSMNFDFITPATVYTIPQNIDYLMRDLLREQGHMGDKKLMLYKPVTFMDAVAEYKFFKKANSNYLNDLLLLRSS